MVTTIMHTESIPDIKTHTPSSLEDGRTPLSPEETLDAARKVEQTLQAWGMPTDHLQPTDPTPPAAPDQDPTPEAPRTWEHLDGQTVGYGQPYGSEEPFKQLVYFKREGDTLYWDANSYTNHEDRTIQMWVQDNQTGQQNNVLVRGNNVYIFKPGTPDQASTYERITLFDTHDLPPATIGQPYAIEGLINGQVLPEPAGDKVTMVQVQIADTNRDEIANANRAREATIMHTEEDLFADALAAADNTDRQLEQAGIPAVPGQVASITLIDHENGKLAVVNESAVEAPATPVDPADAPTDPLDVVDPTELMASRRQRGLTMQWNFAGGRPEAHWVNSTTRTEPLESMKVGQTPDVTQSPNRRQRAAGRAKEVGSKITSTSKKAMDRAWEVSKKATKGTGKGIMKANDMFFAGAYRIGDGMVDVTEKATEWAKIRQARVGAFATALSVELTQLSTPLKEAQRIYEEDIEDKDALEWTATQVHKHIIMMRGSAKASAKAWERRKDDDDDSTPAGLNVYQ